MKISKIQLNEIIREEIFQVLLESRDPQMLYNKLMDRISWYEDQGKAPDQELRITANQIESLKARYPNIDFESNYAGAAAAAKPDGFQVWNARQQRAAQYAPERRRDPHFEELYAQEVARQQQAAAAKNQAQDVAGSAAERFMSRRSSDGRTVTYDFSIEGTPYEVTFKQRSADSPWDMSFDLKDSTGYQRTNKGHMWRLNELVPEMFKDFVTRNPESLEVGYQFTGAEDIAGQGGGEATPRTKIFKRAIMKSIQNDPVFSQSLEVSDLGWAGSPNTVRIKKVSEPSWDKAPTNTPSGKPTANVKTDPSAAPTLDPPDGDEIYRDFMDRQYGRRRGSIDPRIPAMGLAAPVGAAAGVAEFPETQSGQELRTARDVAGAGAGLYGLARAIPAIGLGATTAAAAGGAVPFMFPGHVGAGLSRIPGVGRALGYEEPISVEQGEERYRRGAQAIGRGITDLYDTAAPRIPGTRQHDQRRFHQGVGAELDRLVAQDAANAKAAELREFIKKEIADLLKNPTTLQKKKK